GRLMLVLTNVLPLAAALVGLAWLIDRWSASDWTRVFAVTAACFATFVTTFAVTLNNHSIAAICLVFALVVMLPVIQFARREWWRFAAAGLMLGFLAANELPALSLTLLIAIGLASKCPLRTAIAF